MREEGGGGGGGGGSGSGGGGGGGGEFLVVFGESFPPVIFHPLSESDLDDRKTFSNQTSPP